MTRTRPHHAPPHPHRSTHGPPVVPPPTTVERRASHDRRQRRGPPPRRIRRLAIAAAVGLTAGIPVLAQPAAAGAPQPAGRVCQLPSGSTAATYTVAAGDSWFGIALANGLSARALLAANGAPMSAVLHPGDVLCFPEGTAPAQAPTPAAPPAPACSSMHTVVAGDSWYGIARAAGVTPGVLLEANGASLETMLHPGRELCLPPGATPTGSGGGGGGGDPCAAKHTVVRGDSWYAIARAAGVGTTTLLKANDASADTVLFPGDELCLPPGAAPVSTADPCASKVTVRTGDSWYMISRATRVPMAALFAANDASESTMLHPGDELCLPEVGFGGRRSGLVDMAPVLGSCTFANSFGAARSGGRSHQGLDVIAAAGTPVVAVADGTLTRRLQGAALSGNAWYLTTSDGTYFFYAHLAAFADGLKVGSRVRAGEIIGYVGSTGNAVSPHLHFEIHPYGGGAINPYESIWMIGGCNFDQRYEQSW